jgi:hypothetical protein
MPHRQKNLLEAFQDANDERAGGTPLSAGPFADVPRTDPTTPPRASVLPSFSLQDTRLVLAFVGWGLVCFVAGVVVDQLVGGGDGGGEVRAEGAATGLAATPLRAPVEPPSGASVPAAGEAVNAALQDRANAHTVVAIAYENSESQRELANATYLHFEALGLPVAYPMTYSGKIYILVGAAPTQAELGWVQDAVRSASDPDGRPTEYAGAYVVRIDSVMPR